MSEEDKSSKTEEPTEKKLRDARKKGDVPQSRETGTAMVVFALLMIFVFVLPSVSSEGLPITLVEAMALGRPVVTTRAAGIPEIAEDGVTARVVAPRDAAALSSAIVSVLKDRHFAGRMAAQARAVARERFSADRMARRTEELYLELHGG